MAFVRVDPSRVWRVVGHSTTAPRIVYAGVGTTPYFSFDFSDVLDEDAVISSISQVVEGTATFTASDTSISPDGKSISFKTDALTAGTFEWQATVTLSTGTTQTIEAYGSVHVA